MWDLLGLNDRDEAVYRHFLSHPGATVGQAARATNLSEAQVTATRNRLIACDLLRREQSGDIRVTPAGPALIAERLRDALDAEHARRRHEVSKFQAEMTHLINEHLLAPSRSSRPQVDRIVNIDYAVMRMAELLCSARAEVVCVKPGDERRGSSERDLIMPAELKAAERGVDVRAIYPPTQLLSPGVRRLIDHHIRAGVVVRTAATPATTLTIIDRCVAVVIDHRNVEIPPTLVVREAVLVYALHQLFESCWAHASDATSFLSDGAAKCIGEVSAEERMVLQLLGDGLKDESVAKRLGISVRSVRRKISHLLRRLQADSRFQAGVLAAQRGWIHQTPRQAIPDGEASSTDIFRARPASSAHHSQLCLGCVAPVGEGDAFG